MFSTVCFCSVVSVLYWFQSPFWLCIYEHFRYEGEWLQNDMEGHGVVEVDIPDIEPMPGSKYGLSYHSYY